MRVLAVDGGNSKTVALVADAGGRVLGSGRGGCADVYGDGGPEGALAEIERAAGDALAAAGVRGPEIAATVLSLAGADWPEDFALHRREATRRLGVRDPLVVNDALGALRSGTDEAVGVVAVCGTGGAIGARASDGTVFHLGFWPRGTGGRELGEQALRAVYEEGLGIGPATALTPRLLRDHGVGSAIELLHARTRREGEPVPPVPRLAPAVLDVASGGDEVARAIVMEQAARLGSYARLAAARLGLEGTAHPLVLTGGLLRHPGAGMVVDVIAAALPRARVVRPLLEPVGGALLWALERAGAPADREALEASLPDRALFES